eukprot:77546_1
MASYGLKDSNYSSDSTQYTMNNILAFEMIMGKNFQGNGGLESAKLFLSKLNLKKGQRVLELGCGTGGGAYYMAETYGVYVLGIDLSKKMIDKARDNVPKHLINKIEFLLHDVNQLELPLNEFDLVYSRDCILHINDKNILFNKLYNWLKLNG